MRSQGSRIVSLAQQLRAMRHPFQYSRSSPEVDSFIGEVRTKPVKPVAVVTGSKAARIPQGWREPRGELQHGPTSNTCARLGASNEIADFREKTGAGEEIRTLDIDLGKVITDF